MALIDWTNRTEDHAALVSGVAKFNVVLNLFNAVRIFDKLWRDIRNYSNQVQNWGESKSPAAIADRVIEWGHLRHDLAKLNGSEEKLALLKAGAAIFEIAESEVDVALETMGVAVERLLGTPLDGSTIAVDVADILDQFPEFPRIG